MCESFKIYCQQNIKLLTVKSKNVSYRQKKMFGITSLTTSALSDCFRDFGNFNFQKEKKKLSIRYLFVFSF